MEDVGNFWPRRKRHLEDNIVMVTVQRATITKETRIGVLYGGLSSEREVSLRSGQNCYNALKRLDYKNVELIDVDINLVEVLKQKKIEIAFLSLHGRYGEDGTVQGLLELLKIPYTGSGVLASALAMSKPLTKQVLKANELPFPQTIIVNKPDLKSWDEIEKRLSPPPYMVKPINEGSSVGVTKVSDRDSLKSQVEETISTYGGALIEKYIHGQEITVGVLEDSNGNGNRKAWALPILELRPKSKAGFYDYEAKYTKGMTEFVLPAELDSKTTELAQDLAVKTFKALNCSGYSRVDMMVEAGQPYVLEVNTLPGMTDTSDLPAMAEVAGISYDKLVDLILHSSGLDK